MENTIHGFPDGVPHSMEVEIVGDVSEGPWQDPAHILHRTWRHELPRWLATLNPGRTSVEYEKAVRYFFDTNGVPQELDAITFDLLLAYRAALAQRAASRRRDEPRAPKPRTQPNPALAGPSYAALPHPSTGFTFGGSDSSEHQSHESYRQPRHTALAPATVNIRLTALRQFLTHCILMDTMPQLSLDRMRSALRRLSIERRRPYQVLAEPEWERFVDAALMPSRQTITQPERQIPWGKTRTTPLSPANENNPSSDITQPTHGAYPKTRSGLTGSRTAQRDHALISLALATGLRSIELSELDVRDLVREWHRGQEEWWLALPDAKTKGQHGGRTLPLAPSLVETLLTYIRSSGRNWENPRDQATPLFLSNRTGEQKGDSSPFDRPSMSSTRSFARLTPAHIRNIVDRVEVQWRAAQTESNANPSERISLAGETRLISPHALRHSTAIALLAGNEADGRPPASVEHVRGWLGHFDIRTTQRYLAHLESRDHRRPFTLDMPSSSSHSVTSSTDITASSETSPPPQSTSVPPTVE